MKKLLSCLALLSIATLTYSQNSKIKFGIQAGLNYSNFRGYDIPAEFDPVYSESPAFAFLGGLNFEYQIKEKISLKIEVNFERKSQKADNYLEITNIDGVTKGYDFTTKKEYDYLVLPLLIKYSFTNNNSFYLNGGPFVGFLLKSRLTSDLNNAEGLSNEPVETTAFNKKTDFGLTIGLGKTFEINENNAVFIEIRENLGLTNTSKNKVWGDGEAKTNSLSLILGYSFN